MYARLLNPPENKSFFLFGPRGTGKTHWVKTHFLEGLYLDLLDSSLFTMLLADPHRLESLIPKAFNDWIIIDEVQKVPTLLNEVHRLIEHKKHKFILTGSSARQLRKAGVNLLAGRALTLFMHPLTTIEMGADFDIERALTFGQLPSIPSELDPKKYLEAYVSTYLREEVLQEGLTRNLGAFSRFLEIASFSQGSPLNLSHVSRETHIHRKVVDSYFDILRDLLLAVFLPVFTKRAKRRLVAHPKLYIFDTGVYRTIRPKGPLDSPEEISGIALETLCFQEIRAINDYLGLDFELFYWRTASGLEVDFILYGPKGLIAIEIKRSTRFQQNDLRGLLAFQEEYPEAKLLLIYGGDTQLVQGEIEIMPISYALKNLPSLLNRGN